MKKQGITNLVKLFNQKICGFVSKRLLLLYFRKRPSELNGVYYKMQGVSQVRKNRKSERSKNEASEIMKPGKKLLVKPKMKRIENLLSTPKSEEATEYSQVVNGLNRLLVK